MASSRSSSCVEESAGSGDGIKVFDCEVEEGNTEYKWRLIGVTDERITHLTTQMNWRLYESLAEGGDIEEAFYRLGVTDDGYPKGLSKADMRESMKNLSRMAKGCNAVITNAVFSKGYEGKIAEITIRRNAKEVDRLSRPAEIRVAIVGDMGSGKSTVVGVLCKGQLDNGSGLARMTVFRHNHEIEYGRTSSISQVQRFICYHYIIVFFSLINLIFGGVYEEAGGG